MSEWRTLHTHTPLPSIPGSSHCDVTAPPTDIFQTYPSQEKKNLRDEQTHRVYTLFLQGEKSIILAGGALQRDGVQSAQSVDAAFPRISHMGRVWEALLSGKLGQHEVPERSQSLQRLCQRRKINLITHCPADFSPNGGTIPIVGCDLVQRVRWRPSRGFLYALGLLKSLHGLQ